MLNPPSMDALIVFAKPPEPGAVKTRLTALLTAEEAAALYAAFLQDALHQYAALGVAVRLYLAPSGAALPSGMVPPGVSVHRQQGDGLGARMQHAFVETFAAGHPRAVVIGTDHPTLPSAFIRQAFAALAEPLAVCLGPSDDGGYYLLGMNDFFPQLFEGMAYSHGAVFEQTLSRAAGAGARLTVLPPWYDVDTPAALRRLAAELEAEGAGAPHTRATVHALRRRYPSLSG
ncbi:MAG: TIGR04282 family arsenosugar biosynthesis glycosyltransferase [Rhodothermales bacterium]|nr:TIGR04282 family arsenosugar biosynthesis glycosyltransferase [Rhodothermales bacterium]